MSALGWVVLGLAVATVAFLGWCWVMNRFDAREEERQREAIRRAGPPVLGAPRPPHPERGRGRARARRRR